MNVESGAAAHAQRFYINGSHTRKIQYRHLSRPEHMAAHFGEVYSVFQEIFPHGARKEKFFHDVTSFNRDDAMQKESPASYRVTVASRGSRIIAGSMYMIVPKSEVWPDNRYQAALSMDYRFVVGDEQGNGIAGTLETHARRQAVRFLRSRGYAASPKKSQIIPCNEFAMPMRMPLGAYDEDIRLVRLDPIKRAIIWNLKHNFRRVLPRPGIPFYVEPFSKDGEPRCLYYCFNVKVADGELVSARMIGDIIKRFASYRRMEGGDACQDAYFGDMMRQLSKHEVLRPINDASLLAFLEPRTKAFLATLPADIPPSIKERPVGRLMRGHPRLAAAIAA